MRNFFLNVLSLILVCQGVLAKQATDPRSIREAAEKAELLKSYTLYIQSIKKPLHTEDGKKGYFGLETSTEDFFAARDYRNILCGGGGLEGSDKKVSSKSIILSHLVEGYSASYAYCPKKDVDLFERQNPKWRQDQGILGYIPLEKFLDKNSKCIFVFYVEKVEDNVRFPRHGSLKNISVWRSDDVTLKVLNDSNGNISVFEGVDIFHGNLKSETPKAQEKALELSRQDLESSSDVALAFQTAKDLLKRHDRILSMLSHEELRILLNPLQASSESKNTSNSNDSEISDLQMKRVTAGYFEIIRTLADEKKQAQ